MGLVIVLEVDAMGGFKLSVTEGPTSISFVVLACSANNFFCHSKTTPP